MEVGRVSEVGKEGGIGDHQAERYLEMERLMCMYRYVG